MGCHSLGKSGGVGGKLGALSSVNSVAMVNGAAPHCRCAVGNSVD